MFTLLLLLLLSPSLLSVDFTWCIKTVRGFSKCRDLQHEYTSSGTTTSFLCESNLVKGGCLQEANDQPDTLLTVNPAELYHAERLGWEYRVVLAEDYTDGPTYSYHKYYSVAVVKAGRRDLELLELKDKRVCFGEYDERGATGWDIPVSYLYTYHRKFRMDDRCEVLNAINKYFGQSCLPDRSGSIRDNMILCGACSSKTCSRETRYLGYEGAFRCLVEDAGEVAFLTHETVAKLTDGSSKLAWTEGLKSSDFRLLCPDGSQVNVEDYNQCFVGWMRPDPVIVGRNLPDSDITRIQNSLKNPPPQAANRMFDNSRYTAQDGESVIFSNKTKDLRIVFGSEQYPRNYLGTLTGTSKQYSYTRAMDGLYCITGGSGKAFPCQIVIFPSVLMIMFYNWV